MQELKRHCRICNIELPPASTRIVEQDYVLKPYRRYITREVWDVCIPCFKKIVEEIDNHASNKNQR